MQAESLITDTHLVGFEVDVLQNRRIGEGQREILLNQSRCLRRSDNLLVCQASKANKTAFVHNPLELLGRFEELVGSIPVPYLLGDDMSPAEGGEVALLPVAVLGRLGQEQVAGVIQERSLIEVSLETAGEETHLLLLQVRTVALLDKPILLVYDAVGRQHLDCLYPRGMDRGILRTRHRIKFGKLDPKGDRDVGVFRENTALFDGKQRKAVLQCGGFQ
ncbi:conjugative transposon protein TraG [Prevotella intermedia ZT]|uniref:Conjugative transposon protein TraG n=1 Tax=Prevotella intermedia ZT TaxID=1347790 RepID=A0AAP0VH92_PREIN|nr:conjugative transposon protein TraG [Prevotella intermedia ZT]